MNELNPFSEPEGKPMAELERAIRAAGRYVVPSDDLRPRTIDAARELGVQQREVRRVGWAMLAMACGWLLIFGLSTTTESIRDQIVMPSGDELQQIAFKLASESRDTLDWGLVEAIAATRGIRLRASGSNP